MYQYDVDQMQRAMCDPKRQTVIAIEEAAELQQLLTKKLRGKPVPTMRLAEEISHMYISLEQMKCIYNITDSDIQSEIYNKMAAMQQTKGELR